MKGYLEIVEWVLSGCCIVMIIQLREYFLYQCVFVDVLLYHIFVTL